MKTNKQNNTINSLIEDRYVWTCLSPFAFQLNFLGKLFSKIQGVKDLCYRKNGDNPLFIIPINDTRFEERIIPCTYRYKSSNNKKNEFGVDAYFPYNPFLRHTAIVAWETEGFSIENLKDVLVEMSCETVSIITSGNQFNTFSSKKLMHELKEQALPINISTMIVKGWLKSLSSDIVSEDYAVNEVKKLFDKKEIRCDIVNKYIKQEDVLSIASRRANRITNALSNIERDFSKIKDFIEREDLGLSFYFGMNFNSHTSLTQEETIKLLESLFDVLKPIAKYMPINWQSEYSHFLGNTEYFKDREKNKIQHKLYKKMCDQLKNKLTADINKIIR